MSNHEPQYLITESDNPWIPALNRVTVYDIYYLDSNHRRYLACAPTRAEAEAFIERDRVKPVWDDNGDCRWCGIARSDLARYPAWWFGCVLCESEIDRDVLATVTPEDREYEPRTEAF